IQSPDARVAPRAADQVVQGLGDPPQAHPPAGELPSQVELRLELDLLDHSYSGLQVPLVEPPLDERTTLLVGIQVGVGPPKLDVLILQDAELLLQLVLGLRDQIDDLGVVLLV